MIDYAAQLADLRLYAELKRSAGRDGLTETDVAQLVGMVNHAASVAGPLLALIPQTFRQYTDHDIGHCRNLIGLMGRFIPSETLERLNGLELAVLILSALLHDFGMFVRDEERTAFKRDALTSQAYGAFTAGHHARAAAVEEARRAGEHVRAEAIEDSLLADYFRRMHPQRARDNVRANLGGRLVFRELDISGYVLDVCESHAWGVYESGDPLHPDKTVSHLPTNCAVHAFPLNLQYIACCLRLADIMDFDRSRTPVVVFQNINFDDPESWEEWNKHLSVAGWTIDEREVSFRTECTHPSFYVAVMEFLDWVDAELSNCRRLVVKEAPTDVAERYKLHLPPVADRWYVEMKDKSYLAGGFRFQLEYERIMQLLMDKSLYPDPSLFLRELLQNALDACHNMEALAKEYDYKDYTPRIAVWDYSDDPEDPRVVFQDNGVGMSRKIVENYFMRVGRSYYRSPEFDAERARLKAKGIELEATSQFGIGILSCFMVADRFEVETYRTGNTPLHITIEGPTKYFTIKLLDPPPQTTFPVKPTSDHDDGPPRHPGTRLTLHLRPDTKLDVFQSLDVFAANVDYDINVYRTAPAEVVVIARHQWESEGIQRAAFVETVVLDEPMEDEYDFNTSEVIESLQEIMAPSRIPFERYDFSTNLKGTAWFWLLKGQKDSACPQRGYLKLTDRLRVVGPPAVAGIISNVVAEGQQSSVDESFLIMLRDKAEKGERIARGSRANKIVDSFFPDYEYYDKERFIGEWDKLSVQQRQAVCESLENFSMSADRWYFAPGVPGELLRGSFACSNRSLKFYYSLEFSDRPRSLALHGIRLPAGFVKWNPMAGESRQIELLTGIPSGILVDMRGDTAPTPAANRLFVQPEEAKRGALPFLRACLHHAVELATDRPEKEGWRPWLTQFISSLAANYYWAELISAEYALLEPCFVYRTQVGDEEEEVTRDELVTMFGEWVPLSDRLGENNGIIIYGAESLQLVFKERRKRDDGTLEVNILSKVEIPQEKMGEEINKFKNDLKSAGIWLAPRGWNDTSLFL
ncbi:MAG: ATP-binding protein [Acidobacteria bacterium]|nr:ATP-binding protein [Acidobacteriota bacterium]